MARLLQLEFAWLRREEKLKGGPRTLGKLMTTNDKHGSEMI
jgi:hypothetical protein